MDRFTRLTKAWLEVRYRDPHGHPQGLYYAHEPIYGIGARECEPHHARRIVRLFQLLRRVREAGGISLLDVGGSEGYFSQLCRELFGMEAVSVDLSVEACRRAAELFAMPGCSVDAAALPFASNSFDVVTCAEVVEHLAAPIPAILEMQRVGRTLVLSTEEWEHTEENRDQELRDREARPHTERSIFADADMKPLFTPYPIEFERQVVPNLRNFGDDRKVNLGKFRTALLNLSTGPRAGEGNEGIVILVRKDGVRRETPKTPTDAEIVDHLLQRRMPVHWLTSSTPVVPWPSWCRLRCISCEAPMLAVGKGWKCSACAQKFECENGIVSFVQGLGSHQELIDKALADRGGAAYSEQRRDLLELAAKLQLVFSPGVSWDMTDPGQAQEWRANADLKGAGNSVFRAVGDDPQLESPWLGHDSLKAASVAIEFGVTAEGGGAREHMVHLFWWEEGDPNFTQDKSVTLLIPADGTVRVHEFRAPEGLLGPNGMLMKVRFDPFSHTRGLIEIRRIRLLADAE